MYEDDDDEKTRFANLNALSPGLWSVWRVTTKSGSVYTVGLCTDAKKRFAVMRGRLKEDGTRIEVRDTDPRLDDGRSLFDVAPRRWVDAGLELGTATTSRIVSVVPESDEEEITAVRGLPLAQRAPREVAPPRREEPAPPPPTPYPENHVRELEIAAILMKQAYLKNSLVADLGKQPELYERFRVALGECALMVQALGNRMGRGG